MLARLDDAIARGKTVRFLYPTGPDLGSEERVIDPYVLSRRGGHWYVGGLDHDRGSMRTFRLSRMTGPVRFCTKRVRDFSPPAQIDQDEFGARPPWQFGEIVGTATVKVEDELAWWVSRTYPSVEVAAGVDAPDAPDGGAEAGRPGSTVFTTAYADADELIAWVLSLGRRAVLIDPPEVRDLLRRRLTALEAAHA